MIFEENLQKHGKKRKPLMSCRAIDENLELIEMQIHHQREDIT